MVPEKWLPQVMAAVVGALAAIISAYFTNRAAERRFQQQLAFDATQRAKQREAELRKGIYLEAVEAIAKLQEYLANAGNLNIPMPALAEVLKGANASLAKALLVGSPQAFAAILGVQDLFADLAYKLVIARLPVEKQQLKINEITADINHQTKLQEEIISNAKMSFNQEKNQEFDFYTNWAKQIKDELSEMTNNSGKEYQQLGVLQVDLFKTATKAAETFADAGIEALLIIRKELDQEIDDSEVRRLTSMSLQRRSKASEMFIDGVGKFATDGSPS